MMGDIILISSDSECEEEEYDADNEDAQDRPIFKLERTFKTLVKPVAPNFVDSLSADVKSMLPKMGFAKQRKIAVIKPLINGRSCETKSFLPVNESNKCVTVNLFMLRVDSTEKMNPETSSEQSPNTGNPSSSSEFWSQTAQKRTAKLDKFLTNGAENIDVTDSEDETSSLNNEVLTTSKADAICMKFSTCEDEDEASLSSVGELPDLEIIPSITSKMDALSCKEGFEMESIARPNGTAADIKVEVLVSQTSAIETGEVPEMPFTALRRTAQPELKSNSSGGPSIEAKFGHNGGQQPMMSEVKVEKSLYPKRPLCSIGAGTSPKKAKLEMANKKILQSRGSYPEKGKTEELPTVKMEMHYESDCSSKSMGSFPKRVEAEELPTMEMYSESEYGSSSDAEHYFPGFAVCARHKKQEDLCSLWYRQYLQIRKQLTSSFKNCENCRTLHVLTLGGNVSNERLACTASTSKCPGTAKTSRAADVEVITISDSEEEDGEGTNRTSLAIRCAKAESDSEYGAGSMPSFETKPLMDRQVVEKQSPKNTIQAPELSPERTPDRRVGGLSSEGGHTRTRKLKRKIRVVGKDVPPKPEQVDVKLPKQELIEPSGATPSTSQFVSCLELSNLLENCNSEDEFQTPESSFRNRKSPEKKVKVKAASIKSVDRQLIWRDQEVESKYFPSESQCSSKAPDILGSKNDGAQPVDVNEADGSAQGSRPDDVGTEAALASKIDVSIEQVYVNCLEQANGHHSLGMHAIYNLCDRTAKPSVAVVEAVLKLWRKSDVASTAQQCMQVIYSIQRNHRALGNLKLWPCIRESATILETSIDLVNIDANMHIVELVTRIMEEDLQEQVITHGKGRKNWVPKRSLAYKWLSNSITAIRNWMCSAIVRSNEPCLADVFSPYFECLSRLLNMALTVCQNKEISIRNIANDFCIMYSKLSLWKQRHLLISQIRPAQLRLQLSTNLLDCHASKKYITEKRFSHFSGHELSLGKILKYYFLMGSFHFGNAHDGDQSDAEKEERIEEIVFVQSMLLSAFLELNKRTILKKVARVDRLQDMCYQDCPTLAQNAKFQQTLLSLRLLFM